MTDVLDQLRFMERSASLAAAPVMKTAADEIARLRAENERLLMALDIAIRARTESGPNQEPPLEPLQRIGAVPIRPSSASV